MELTNLYMDTHKIVRLLQEKGYSEQEAEGFIQAIQEITLTGVASKEDLRRVDKKLGEMESTLKTEIHDIKMGVATLETKLLKEISNTKSELQKLMIGTVLTGVGLTVALIKLLG